jgi:hypothetical protein
MDDGMRVSRKEAIDDVGRNFARFTTSTKLNETEAASSVPVTVADFTF